ncbi:MAG: S8 family serine peptidase [Barnesiella sp.]|nr:S8 family serine peptidase [Barnesiella sp.]
MKSLRNYLLLSLSLAVSLPAFADKLSPDTRIHLEQRARKAPARFAPKADLNVPAIPVFIAFELGFNTNRLNIDGVTVQSVFGKVATALATPDAIEAIADIEGVTYVQMASEVKLLNDWARRDTKVDNVHKNIGNTLPQGYTGKGVVVGIIDTGVEYGHRAFYSSDGKELRIRRAWQQNTMFGNAPEGYTYGKELTTPEEMLTEACDSRSQYHGSHTMGTAAGGGDLNTVYTGVAPDADIVFVSFKSDDNTCIADGIKYIFDYADEVGLPCVINMSLGSHHGPHDGTSYLDQVIDELTGPGRIVVGAVGNEGEARMHASKTFTDTDRTMKTMLTLNADAGHRLHYVDIWGTPGSNLKLNMGVFNSLKGQTLDLSKVVDTSDPDQHVVAYFTYIDEVGVDMDAYIYSDINPENNCPHIYVQAQVGDLGQGRMPGIIIEGDPGATVNMWNEGQNEFSSSGRAGFTNGDQNSTVGEIGGTAKRIITVGSYDSRDTVQIQQYWGISMSESSLLPYEQHKHSVFSSYGPTADGRTVPHVLAPGMPVISALNRYALPTDEIDNYMSSFSTDASGRKYYYIYSMGTSMSAPHVTGTIALMLQANPELTPEQARDIIQASADTNDYMGTLPNNTYGAGRLNALKCVQGAVEALGTNGVADVPVDDNATQVWAHKGSINVVTPAVGATLRLYSLTGALLTELTLESAATVIDASRWSGIVIAEVSGQSTRSTFKLAL